jgi:hypothetical protein
VGIAEELGTLDEARALSAGDQVSGKRESPAPWGLSD